MSDVKPPFTVEEYSVEMPPPPESFDLLASGVKIGQVKIKGEYAYAQAFEQSRLFVEDMIAGVKQYLQRTGYGVEFVLWDKEYERFEFKIFIRR